MAKTKEQIAQSNRERQLRYIENHERIDIKVNKGTKDRIKALGYTSVQGFVKRATMDKIEAEENK